MPMTPSTSIPLKRQVFFPAAVLIIFLAGFAMLAPNAAQSFFDAIQRWILTNASWFYILAVAVILASVVFLAISRYGEIRLGPDHSKPDYRNFTWFSMLFSAGMGIGLMFFGVAEPVMHLMAPPTGEPGTILAAKEAMKLTFFHWGLHAWAIYAVVGLILAYFSYRHNLPLTLRSALYPLIGKRIHGPIGHAVDIFAILGTVAGVATSLGLGVAQINSGLHYLFGMPVSVSMQVLLIVITCALATLSVVSGLDRGIRILSETNLYLAAILLLFVLILGPTIFLLQTFVQNTGAYLSDIVSKTFNLYAYEPNDWIGGWTLFYWGWWLAWSPFVGLFIARISRGRTIREFIGGVLLVPAVFTLFWMTVFGDSAIHLILVDHVQSLAEMVKADSSLALFAFLEQFPFSRLTSMIAIIMVVVFFVTSADSGALVVDLLASGGASNTPLWQRVFWSVLIGAIAIALLLANGLSALQTATIASALPFAFVLLVSLMGLFRALRLDATKRELCHHTHTFSRLATATADQDSWESRLRNIVMMPRRAHTQRFISDVVIPALNSVRDELHKQGYGAEVSEEENHAVTLRVLHGQYLDFLYGVRSQEYVRPGLTIAEFDEEETRKYFRAEVYLHEGGQDYDIMGWSREAVINDILDQYERHRHYLHVVQ